MAERRESTWTGRDVLIASGVGAVVLVVLALAVTRGPLQKRSRCEEYAARFRREVDEGHIRYADVTEQLARRDGCRWAMS